MKTERAIELLHRLQDEQFDGVHGDERREALSMAVRALLSQQIVNDSQGLVNDCISRKMAIDAFEPEHDTDWYTPQIIEVLEALPPVQPTQTNADSTQSNTLDCVSRRAAMIVIENSGLDDDSKDTVVRVLEQLPSAQPETHDKRTETHECDLISREKAIDAVNKLVEWYKEKWHESRPTSESVIDVLNDLPSAQPQWIPCSERLPEHPENDDYYLVTIQCEHYDGWDDYVTGFAEWTKHGWDELSCYIGQIKVIAWMPLPKAYGGDTK